MLMHTGPFLVSIISLKQLDDKTIDTAKKLDTTLRVFDNKRIFITYNDGQHNTIVSRVNDLLNQLTKQRLVTCSPINPDEHAFCWDNFIYYYNEHDRFEQLSNIDFIECAYLVSITLKSVTPWSEYGIVFIAGDDITYDYLEKRKVIKILRSK